MAPRKRSRKKQQPTGRSTEPSTDMLQGIQKVNDEITYLWMNEWISPADPRIQHLILPAFQDVMILFQDQKPSARVDHKLKKNNWFVENIRGIKWCRGSASSSSGLQYLIKWEDWAESSNSWDPERNLSCPDLIMPFEDLADLLKSQNSSGYRRKKVKAEDTTEKPDAKCSNNHIEEKEEGEEPDFRKQFHQSAEQFKKQIRGPAGDHLLYYDLLQVDPSATQEQIIKSFRRLSLKHHPDRHVEASDEERKKHEELFKRGNTAKVILTSPDLRLIYDRGEDPLVVKAEAEAAAAAAKAAHHHHQQQED